MINKWIKELLNSEKPLVLGIQETKIDRLHENFVQYLWGSDNFGYSKVDAIGASGGILTV